MPKMPTSVDWRAAFLAAALSLGYSHPSAAQTANSAGSILPACREFLDARPLKFGEGYCVGIVEGTMLLADTLPTHLRFCPPPDVRIERGVAEVVRYADHHPERVSPKFFYLFVIEALRAVWPCP
jgi:hypothetical protein